MFYKHSKAKDGLTEKCKSCVKIRVDQYRKSEQGRIAKAKSNHNYGIKKCGATPEQWDAKFNDQLGCCAICGIHQSKLEKRLATDHNHITGEFRGLLCDKCNRAVGLLNDNLSNCLKAADYLTKYLSNDTATGI